MRAPTPPTPVLDPASLPERGGTSYPEPYRAVVDGRTRRVLGDPLGLKNFGVNLCTLQPGAASSMRHWHTRQDEFVYVLEGEVTLVTDAGETVLRPGMAAGFPAGRADGHHFVNRSDRPAVFLEVGDRLPGDEAHYPDADLRARAGRAPYQMLHKDGTPWA